jgi:hypothetical protein
MDYRPSHKYLKCGLVCMVSLKDLFDDFDCLWRVSDLVSETLCLDMVSVKCKGQHMYLAIISVTRIPKDTKLRCTGGFIRSFLNQGPRGGHG